MPSALSIPDTQAPLNQVDFTQACRALSAYSQSTGVSSFIINAKGKVLFEPQTQNTLCRHCHNSCGKNFDCSDVHLYGSYQAERFGGSYVFFCPIGLTHWAAPLTNDGRLCGAMIGGPVMMVDPGEFMLDEFAHSSGLSDAQKLNLDEFSKEVPVRSSETVTSLSTLLTAVASGLSTGGADREKWEKNAMQAKISTSIQDLKESESGKASRAANYPFDKEQLLLSSIATGDKAVSQKTLNEILGFIFFSSGMDFEIIRARIEELTVLLSRAAIKGGADVSEIFGLNYRYLSEIKEKRTIEDITYWLSNILARFTDCVFNLAEVRHKDIIYKALNYIQKNYMKKISLEEVANAVYLAPSYFSKIFKDETGSSFVSYINKVRVDVSRELLLDLAVPLTDIANLVGFEEQSYYTKVFKKITGVTPGSYRQSMGASRSE